MQKTTIQIDKTTQEKLKKVGTMNDTYDSLINKLIDEHERLKNRNFLVETQYEIAKKGNFVELE